MEKQYVYPFYKDSNDETISPKIVYKRFGVIGEKHIKKFKR